MRPRAPGLDELLGVRAAVVSESLQLRIQVVAGRLRSVPEDVGVELAPGQLVGEPADVVGLLERPEVCQQRARVDRAVLEVHRQPAGAVGPGQVAAVGVPGQPLVPEPLPGRVRRCLTGGRERDAVQVGTLGQIVGADAVPPPDLDGRGAGARQPCARQARAKGEKTLNGVPSSLVTRPGVTA